MTHDQKPTKVLAYCAFLHDPKLSLPLAGVGGASINVLERDRLRLLWSQVEWPFEPSAFQQRAVEFHRTVHHLFAQTAVVPFRLLSLFDEQQSLADFVVRHGSGLIDDLERLETVVQMECIIFFKAPGRPDLSSGSAYLHQKAGLQRALKEFSEHLKSTLSSVSGDVRIRDVKNGKRIYCQVRRGHEDLFRTTAQAVSVPPL
ncbi:MAG TPA: GvpL/GvpF family gas vesicle protein, partial [Nitrososphaera sp.]|nr:GvpL/GvpF family gas vesicle protein [Nitrososphaera sp.]